MIAGKMQKMVENSSVIRAMFEEGQKMAREYGDENVYDFSLGNPSVPAPKAVRDAIVETLDTEDPLTVHGYMANSGYEDVRAAIAEDLNSRFQTDFSGENIVMTVGAAGGLNVILKVLLNPGDEVIAFAPFFAEYGNYVGNYDGKLISAAPDTETFQLNLEDFAGKITNKTKAVIINNPNNPSGAVYSAETLQKLGHILREKQHELGTQIYLLSDEPYRELVYDGVTVPFPTKYFANTIVCYSWSKSLSLPGERIGYLAIPNECDCSQAILQAAAIATRILGFVNAPSLMQRAVAKILGEKTDIAAYDRNRLLLWNGLKDCGFSCMKPQGAFYLFMKSPEPDDNAFVQRAKKYHILMVPGSSFACPGYVRIAYCVAQDTIERSLPLFRKLAEEYGLTH